MDSLFSDKLASPSGAIWPLFAVGSHFFLSSACFALHPVGLAESSELPVRFCMTFAHESTISSSTSLLHIAWVSQQHELVLHLSDQRISLRKLFLQQALFLS
jgi:hypothetical protein